MPSLRGMKPGDIVAFLDNYSNIRPQKKDRRQIDKELILFLQREDVKKKLYKGDSIDVNVGGTLQREKIVELLRQVESMEDNTQQEEQEEQGQEEQKQEQKKEQKKKEESK